MLVLVSTLFATACLALVSHQASANTRFEIDFSVDDLHFTNEEIERDLFRLFERIGA